MRPAATLLLWAVTVAAPLTVVAGALIAPASAALDPPQPYVVRGGDTFWSLSQRYLSGVGDIPALRKANPGAKPAHLKIGSTIQLPYDLLKTSPEFGKVIAFKGDAFVTHSGTAARAALGTDVVQGDILTTGANAFMTLEMADASHLTLPSQSSVKVTHLRQILLTKGRDVDFLVTSGRSHASVTKLRAPEDHFRVRTPVSVAAVRGTQFRVGFDPEKAYGVIEVLEGLVGVSDKDGANIVAVPSLSGLITSASGPSTVQGLLAAPKLIKPGRTQAGPALAFEVTPMNGAQSYRGQLANDAGFTDLFAETVSDKPGLTFEGPPDGTYFVRVAALGAAGLEGAAKVYAFDRELFVPGGPPRPSQFGKQRRYGFKWSGGSADTRFRFQLSRDKDFVAVMIDQASLKDKSIVVTDLPKGNYWWRVVVSKVREGRVQYDTTPAQVFEVAGS